MNFLGHLLLSNNDLDLMYANLFGDFVKGSDLSRFPDYIQHGIRLHRAIDSYIDHHPIVTDLMHQLYEPLPRIAGIAIDLFFDHIIAKNWDNYHSVELGEFTENFYRYSYDQQQYTDEFNFVISKMKEKNWLYQYQFQYGLKKACEGVSRRISFENTLHNGLSVYNEHQEKIDTACKLFLAEAIPHFSKFTQ